MTRFSTYASAFVLLTAISSPVFAADINGSTKDTSFGPMAFASSEGQVNWSGFYVGVQGGYGNANHNLTVQEYEEDYVTTCPATGGSGFCAGKAAGDYVQPGDEGASLDLLNIDGLNSHGAIGGGRIGYDFARGRLLFGAFAEYNFSSMETQISGLALRGVTVGLEKEDEWSVGGRIGYIVAPRTLAYVLAAYTQTEYNVTGLDSIPLGTGESLKTGASFDGITVGGGVEFALASNVFFGVEYQHTFYGEETVLDFNEGGNGAEGVRLNDELDEDKILATLKLKLNGFGQ